MLGNYLSAIGKSLFPPKKEGVVYVGACEGLPGFFSNSRGHTFYINAKRGRGHLDLSALDPSGREYSVLIVSSSNHLPKGSEVLTPRPTIEVMDQYAIVPPGIMRGLVAEVERLEKQALSQGENNVVEHSVPHGQTHPTQQRADGVPVIHHPTITLRLPRRVCSGNSKKP